MTVIYEYPNRGEELCYRRVRTALLFYPTEDWRAYFRMPFQFPAVGLHLYELVIFVEECYTIERAVRGDTLPSA